MNGFLGMGSGMGSVEVVQNVVLHIMEQGLYMETDATDMRKLSNLGLIERSLNILMNYKNISVESDGW